MRLAKVQIWDKETNDQSDSGGLKSCLSVIQGYNEMRNIISLKAGTGFQESP